MEPVRLPSRTRRRWRRSSTRATKGRPSTKYAPVHVGSHPWRRGTAGVSRYHCHADCHREVHARRARCTRGEQLPREINDLARDVFARRARFWLREQEVPGSNPGAPTDGYKPSALQPLRRAAAALLVFRTWATRGQRVARGSSVRTTVTHRRAAPARTSSRRGSTSPSPRPAPGCG